MQFSKPVGGTVPGEGVPITFSRINISTKNSDGSVGELVMPTSRLFSFGVGENISKDTGKPNGWTMPLCLYNKDGPSECEKCWVETFDKIVKECVEHLLENKEDIDKFELERSDLKKFNPLYWKKEKKIGKDGKTTLVPVPGAGPTLYTKLIYSKKSEKFVSIFRDMNDNIIDPVEMLGKYCYTTAAIKIESIFIGKSISLQVKLYEVRVEPIQSGMKRLLPRPTAQSTVTEASNSAPVAVLADNSDCECESDDEGSIDEPAPAPVPVVEKKVVRKVVKKK
jgi:hypothetical protein